MNRPGTGTRIVEGRAEGGYMDVYELICCDCGDHPDLDYRDVSPELPYPIAAGVAAYEKLLKLHPRRQSFAGRTGQVHDAPATGTGGRP
jgi:hypothetical protein